MVCGTVQQAAAAGRPGACRLGCQRDVGVRNCVPRASSPPTLPGTSPCPPRLQHRGRGQDVVLRAAAPRGAARGAGGHAGTGGQGLQLWHGLDKWPLAGRQCLGGPCLVPLAASALLCFTCCLQACHVLMELLDPSFSLSTGEEDHAVGPQLRRHGAGERWGWVRGASARLGCAGGSWTAPAACGQHSMCSMCCPSAHPSLLPGQPHPPCLLLAPTRVPIPSFLSVGVRLPSGCCQHRDLHRPEPALRHHLGCVCRQTVAGNVVRQQQQVSCYRCIPGDHSLCCC